MKLYRWMVAGLAVLTASVTACGGDDGGADGAGGASAEQVMLAVPEAINDLDPHTAQSTWERSVLRLAYDTLVARTPDGTIVSGLAESWEAAPDRITLTLRGDATCADGTPLRASTVAANFERLKDPATAAPYTETFLGSADFEVTADDDARTVTLQLPQPLGYVLANLTHYPSIVCQAGLDAPDRLTSETFGTGPFQLTDVQAGDRLTFEARDGYTWGPDGATTDDPGVPREVVVRIVTNETTAANLLLDGELDLARLSEVEAERAEATDGDLEPVQVPNALHAIWFNYTDSRPDNPALDEGVRRALAQAIDRPALSQASVGTEDAVVNSVTQLPNSPCADDVPADSVAGFQPDEAPDTLEEAGWTRDGSGPWTNAEGQTLALDLLVSGNPGTPALVAGEFVAEAWRDLGIEVNTRTIDETSLAETLAAGEWDVLLRGWTNLFDPSIIVPQYSGENQLRVWMNNPQYNDLVAEATLADEDGRCALYGEADAAINEQVSAYPLFQSAPTFLSPTLTYRPYMAFIDPSSLRVDG